MTFFDDFEDGDRDEYTVTQNVSNASVEAAAAYEGNFGVAFRSLPGGWHYRNDIVTRPGHSYRAFVRTTVLGARFYIGVDAGPDGAITAAFAPNSDTVELNNFTDYAVVDPIASDGYNIGGATWYQLELEWAVNGQMAARLYNESGDTVLADTGYADVPDLNQNGFVFRGFTGTGNPIYADNFSVTSIPEPASLGLLGVGLLCLTRRRRVG